MREETAEEVRAPGWGWTAVIVGPGRASGVWGRPCGVGFAAGAKGGGGMSALE